MPIKIDKKLKKEVLNRTRRLRKLSRYIDARAVFKDDQQFKDYLEYNRLLKQQMPMLSHNDRLVLISNYHFGWGKNTIRKRIRISKRSFYKVKMNLQSYDAAMKLPGAASL